MLSLVIITSIINIRIVIINVIIIISSSSSCSSSAIYIIISIICMFCIIIVIIIIIIPRPCFGRLCFRIRSPRPHVEHDARLENAGRRLVGACIYIYIYIYIVGSFHRLSCTPPRSGSQSLFIDRVSPVGACFANAWSARSRRANGRPTINAHICIINIYIYIYTIIYIYIYIYIYISHDRQTI